MIEEIGSKIDFGVEFFVQDGDIVVGVVKFGNGIMILCYYCVVDIGVYVLILLNVIVIEGGVL